MHGFRYQPDLNLLSYTTRELDEEVGQLDNNVLKHLIKQETLTNNSSEISANASGSQQEHPQGRPIGDGLTISTGSSPSSKVHRFPPYP